MIRLTAEQIASAVGGSVHQVRPGHAGVIGVCVDSRHAEPDSLFVCVVGQRVDGHEYVDEAFGLGATLVLASRPVDGPHVLVEDVVVALGRLARAVLDQLPDLRIVAVTGSSGKTSTKDLIAAVAAEVGPTVAAVGSFNTEIGLPLTALRVDGQTRVLVVEMGARGAGHIAYLCGIAPPQVAVVLNVGQAHVGEFGSVSAIAAAKAEIVASLPSSGFAILNADDERVDAMAAATSARVLRFGEHAPADVCARDVHINANGQASFTLVSPSGFAPVALRLVGRHQVSNALAAAAVGHALDLPVRTVAAVLTAAEARSRWRMEVTTSTGGVTVINDAYNANPESVRAAIAALDDLSVNRRSWAVLGEMRELGGAHEEEHREVGRNLARQGVQRLVVVGEGARPILDGARMEGSPAPSSDWVTDVEEAIQLLQREVAAGDVVLVKASRSVGLERVAAALLGEHEQGDRP